MKKLFDQCVNELCAIMLFLGFLTVCVGLIWCIAQITSDLL